MDAVQTVDCSEISDGGVITMYPDAGMKLLLLFMLKEYDALAPTMIGVVGAVIYTVSLLGAIPKAVPVNVPLSTKYPLLL